MKRKCVLSLALIAGLLGGVAAHAECRIQLSEAQVNYDTVTRGELVSRPGNSLNAGELRSGDERTLDISVNCDQPTPLSLQFVGPAKEGDSYRFGARGRATLVLHDVWIDDRQVAIVSDGEHAQQMAFRPANSLSFLKDGAPAVGSNLRGRVTITTWMPSDATRVGERQKWQLDGSMMVGGAS